MKTICSAQHELISGHIAAEGAQLRGAMLEKDAIVTEALRAVSAICLPRVTLTFSGGTCLGKAYGILERMSEDIDLRLRIDDPDLLSRSAVRRIRSELKATLIEAFRAAGFTVPEESIRARNENQFIAMDLLYHAHYPVQTSLRPAVRVEFMAIAPRLPTVTRSIRPLIDELTGEVTAEPFTLACLAIDETLCEKIVSYLRRCGEHLSGRQPSQYDGRLARHVYDVHRILTVYYGGEIPGTLRPLFREIVLAETEQYGQRDPAFCTDPFMALRHTLRGIPLRADFTEHYAAFARDLLYGTDRPTFDEAFNSFWQTAVWLLAGTASAARDHRVSEPRGEYVVSRPPRLPAHIRPAAPGLAAAAF